MNLWDKTYAKWMTLRRKPCPGLANLDKFQSGTRLLSILRNTFCISYHRTRRSRGDRRMCCRKHFGATPPERVVRMSEFLEAVNRLLPDTRRALDMA